MPKSINSFECKNSYGLVKIILLIVLLVIGFLVFFFYKKTIIFPKITINETPPATSYTDKKNQEDNSFIKQKGQEEYTDRVVLSEVVLLKKALTALIDKSWDPKMDEALVTYKDLGENDLVEMIKSEKTKAEDQEIPDNIKNLLSSYDEVNDIYKEIFTDYELYIKYLVLKDVKEDYISELKTRTLPEDGERIIYTDNLNLKSTDSFTEPIEIENKTDYSQLKMNIFAYDLYKNMKIIIESKIFDSGLTSDQKSDAYYKNIRNTAIKYIVFREMTRSLQRAIITVNSPDIEKTAEDAWVYSTKNLINADKKYYWKWGTQYYTESENNKALTEESQAYGIAFELITNKMTDEQKAIFWDFEYGKYDDMRKILDDMKNLFEEKYPNYSPDKFPQIINKILEEYPDQEGKQILEDIVKKLDFFPSYVGKMHPMRPEDTKWFWNSLKV